MKAISVIFALLFTTSCFAKEPPKEFLSRKVGVWNSAQGEIGPSNYTVQEVAKNGFLNVISQSWDSNDDAWILIVKSKDAMTAKKHTIRMQFPKSMQVVQPTRIVMDTDEFPMNESVQLMATLVANTEQKLGKRESANSKAGGNSETKKDVTKDADIAKATKDREEKDNQTIDSLVGKYCWDDLRFEFKRFEPKSLSISVKGKKCNFEDQKFTISNIKENVILAEVKPKCDVQIVVGNKRASGRSGLELYWHCDEKLFESISGCNIAPLNGVPDPCD